MKETRKDIYLAETVVTNESNIYFYVEEKARSKDRQERSKS